MFYFMASSMWAKDDFPYSKVLMIFCILVTSKSYRNANDIINSCKSLVNIFLSVSLMSTKCSFVFDMQFIQSPAIVLPPAASGGGFLFYLCLSSLFSLSVVFLIFPVF